MSGHRQERVAEAIREVLSELVLRELKDPRVQGVTITRVDVSPDLRNARVYFSTVGSEQDHNRATQGLIRSAGFLRSHLTRELQLRYAPELRFVFDHSIEEAEKLNRLIHGDKPSSDD